jgi:hypothetical protein
MNASAILPETYAAIAAALAGAVVVAKKLITRHRSLKPEHVTRETFDAALEATRNRIGAGYLALAEKIDTNHRQLLSAIDRLSTTTEHRLDRLDSTVARLDERTLR